MRNGKFLRRIYLLLIPVLLAVALTVISCDEPGYKASYDEYDNIVSSPDPSYNVSYDEAGNKIITIKEGIGYFSIVYPDDFVLFSVKTDTSGIETLMTYFVGPVTPGVNRAGISINVGDDADIYPAEAAARNMLDFASKLTAFQLLDQSVITVSGVTAYQHSYYTDEYPYDPHFKPPTEESTLVTWLTREVFFDHSSYSWTLRLGSNPAREEQDMATFDTILESFKVLN